VLRYGYVVAFDAAGVPGMLDHLTNGIIGDSIRTLKSPHEKGWRAAADVIVDLAKHQGVQSPPRIRSSKSPGPLRTGQVFNEKQPLTNAQNP
jgi:hypothetical protein